MTKVLQNLYEKYFFKYRSIILYIFFGGITTLINIISYYVSYRLFDIANVPSTIIAWILSVIFAFITNKTMVFESKSWKREVFIKELISFVSVRLLTGAIDLGFMYITVDLLKNNEILMKILSNVFVLVSNYIGSKLFIFKKKN